MYTSYSVWSVGYVEPGSPRLSLSSSVGARYSSSISVCIRRMRSSWTLIGNTAPKAPIKKKTLQSDYVYWSRWLESSLPSQWCELGVQYIEIPRGQSHTSTCYCSIDGTAWQIYDCKHKTSSQNPAKCIWFHFELAHHDWKNPYTLTRLPATSYMGKIWMYLFLDLRSFCGNLRPFCGNLRPFCTLISARKNQQTLTAVFFLPFLPHVESIAHIVQTSTLNPGWPLKLPHCAR